MQQYLQNKKGLVKKVFNKVFNKYDLMNDLMSFGVHRIWKRDLIQFMNPSKNKRLIDVACGTGDLGKIYLDIVGSNEKILCVDSNKKMISEAKKKLKNYNHVNWLISDAEKLPIPNNIFDFYTIGFGLRNTKDIKKTIKEAFRVLKPGGRFLCLEFSKVENSNLNYFYKNYSKLIPKIGELVVGERIPYKYLVESIEKFINQEELIDLMKSSKFENCTYKNLSGGIVSIHSGWKI